MIAADWPVGEASLTGEEREPTGLLGELGFLSSAVLVVAVMGRCGIRIAMGAVCSCGKSLGGEIFPCTNVECSGWIKRFNVNDKTTMYQFFFSGPQKSAGCVHKQQTC